MGLLAKHNSKNVASLTCYLNTALAKSSRKQKSREEFVLRLLDVRDGTNTVCPSVPDSVHVGLGINLINGISAVAGSRRRGLECTRPAGEGLYPTGVSVLFFRCFLAQVAFPFESA